MMEPLSRQTLRYLEREKAKADRAKTKEAVRKEARRALLKRQTAREKSGAYEGRSVAASVSPSRSRINDRSIIKGEAYGRYLTNTFHATKGVRPFIDVASIRLRAALSTATGAAS